MGLKIKITLLTLASFFALAIAGPALARVAATGLFDVCNNSEVSGGSGSAACNSRQEPISGTNGVILKAATMVALFAGVAAVIMIMIAGLTYINSGGDSSKISQAKNIIMYTLIGMAVVILARTIIGFVLSKA